MSELMWESYFLAVETQGYPLFLVHLAVVAFPYDHGTMQAIRVSAGERFLFISLPEFAAPVQ